MLPLWRCGGCCPHAGRGPCGRPCPPVPTRSRQNIYPAITADVTRSRAPPPVAVVPPPNGACLGIMAMMQGLRSLSLAPPPAYTLSPASRATTTPQQHLKPPHKMHRKHCGSRTATRAAPCHTPAGSAHGKYYHCGDEANVAHMQGAALVAVRAHLWTIYPAITADVTRSRASPPAAVVPPPNGACLGDNGHDAGVALAIARSTACLHSVARFTGYHHAPRHKHCGLRTATRAAPCHTLKNRLPGGGGMVHLRLAGIVAWSMRRPVRS